MEFAFILIASILFLVDCYAYRRLHKSIKRHEYANAKDFPQHAWARFLYFAGYGLLACSLLTVPVLLLMSAQWIPVDRWPMSNNLLDFSLTWIGLLALLLMLVPPFRRKHYWHRLLIMALVLLNVFAFFAWTQIFTLIGPGTAATPTF